MKFSENDEKRRDEMLRRMLNTPPKPHNEKDKKPVKKRANK